MHELDALDLERIDAEPLPETGLGLAIMDRLAPRGRFGLETDLGASPMRSAMLGIGTKKGFMMPFFRALRRIAARVGGLLALCLARLPQIGYRTRLPATSTRVFSF